jgi:L-seryl-tRNA(Ser) seleniumtransferase
MTENNGPAWERLPDTDGLARTEIILQSSQAVDYKYINPLRLSGARIRLAGSHATSVDDLVQAVGDKTAAILVPAHLDAIPGSVPISKCVSIAKRAGINVIVDAAYQMFPPAQAAYYNSLGADLVCFSSKYYGGPNAGGFVSGRRGLIETIAGLDFTNFESGPYRSFGRPFKMGRYEVAAVALALQEWFAADHRAREKGEADRAERVRKALERRHDLNVELMGFTLDARLVQAPVNAAAIILGPGASLTPEDLIKELAGQSPSIRVLLEEGLVLVITETLRDGQELMVARAISRALDARA